MQTIRYKWLKSPKHKTSVDKDTDKQELIAGQNAKCTAILKDNLVVSHKIKNTLTI